MLLGKDALQISAALVVQVGTVMLTRRSVGHLALVHAPGLELLNELSDIWRGGEPELRRTR